MRKTGTINLLSRLAIISFTILICVYFDQITKAEAQTHLRAHASISVIDNVLYFVYAENTGTMLSIGSTLPENLRYQLFVVLIGLVLAAVTTFVLARPLPYQNVLAASLVVGGGLGNLIDRVIHNGSVIDFILIKLGSLETGIFNVADIAITLGTLLLLFLFMTSHNKRT